MRMEHQHTHGTYVTSSTHPHTFMHSSNVTPVAIQQQIDYMCLTATGMTVGMTAVGMTAGMAGAV